MAQTPNIVNWGLAASGWFKITVDEDGKDVYGEVTKFVGNRQINFTPAGELVNVYADGTTILVGKNNNGYTGSIESTFLDEEFLEWALSEVSDAKKVQYEIQEPVINRFGLVWEWVGDKSRTRHVMYNVTANRPDINATTAGDGGTKSAQYQTISLIAIPRADGLVKARTGADIDQAVYDAWFTTVYDPFVVGP